jgi:CRISPR-associated endoribonuclease Cas6
LKAEQTAGSLSLGSYRVSFEARESLDLPHYIGSTLRGAFGHAFRAIACHAPRGLECPVPAQCPYHLIFETSPPPGSDALRTHEEIPRPFVMAPVEPVTPASGGNRQQFRPGDKVTFDLILIGRAQEYFPYFVVALREVTRIGRGRQAVEMSRIETRSASGDESRIVYDAAQNVVHGAATSITLEQCGATAMPAGPLTIEFLTQTRLKHEGRFVRRPEFQILFRRLLGRLSSLARFHCGTPLDVDFRGLIEQAASIQLVRDETRWTRWERYSSRQDRRMEWEGIMGRAVYEGDFAPFWKFLKFGESLHVGHGATFGLGKYRISDAESARGRH